MGEEGKDICRRFWEEVWNGRDTSKLGEFGTEDLVIHVGGAAIPGAQLGAALASQWFDPFPDLHVEIVLQVSEGDYVAEHLVFSGTHTGAPFHPGLFKALGMPALEPSGVEFEFTQTSILRLSGSQIAEIWEDFDRIRLFRQLGMQINIPLS